MVEKYLYRGEMFILCDDEVKSVCVVTHEQSAIYEIKNIVTNPKYQCKGYGNDNYDFSIRETQTYEIIEDVARMKSEVAAAKTLRNENDIDYFL